MDGGNNGHQPDQAGWVFKPGSSAVPTPPEPHAPPKIPASNQKGSVEWTASEYIAHEKNTNWYMKVMLVAVVVAGLVYLITRDIFSTIMILFAGLIFAVAAARKPRVVAYRVDSGGLTVGQKYYPFSQFKSYAVLKEGSVATVLFMPMKRFMPSVDIYIPPENTEEILAVLANSLPLETHKPGLVDTFTNRIRF